MSTASAGRPRASNILLRNAASHSALSRPEVQVTIDNLDGSGPQDYSSAILRDAPLRIDRKLNAPSACTFDVLVTPGGPPLPARRGRLVVSNAEGAPLFTGYLATEPLCAQTEEGPCVTSYRAEVNAVSDEWLLERMGPIVGAAGGFSLGLDARDALERLLQSVGGDATGLVVESGIASGTLLGQLALEHGVTWTAGARAAATASYAAYRALDGRVSVPQAGTTVHSLSDADGTLAIANLSTASAKELANDVTVSGELEPTTYVTEVFAGDGTTSDFLLAEPAFHEPHSLLLQDSFANAIVDGRQWSLEDPGGHLSVTSAGLTMNGGNGVDGDTTLTALNAVEMGGSIVVELRGVQLHANSDGVLGGMYLGPAALATCFAGFRVRQSGESLVVVPVISGAEAGMAFTLMDGHRYTLRLRLHCTEVQRAMQRYLCMVDGAVQTFGNAAGVNAPMDAVFELRDEGASSNTPATVLYDTVAAGTTIALTPAACVFVAANSTHLYGSVGSVSVRRPGTIWVESTIPGGAKQTRLVGATNEGADCSATNGSEIGGPGKVSFLAGRVPVAGERVTVRYRPAERAVARVADAVSIAAESAGGVPGTSRWVGKALQPPARSSVDCESAAQAVLAFSTSRSAAISGTYTWMNPAEDVWPGDLLEVTRGGVTTALLVRRVLVEDTHAASQGRRYTISFANDWATEIADGLGLKLSDSIPSDVVLPNGAGEERLASLNNLQVFDVSGSVLQIDTGLDAPSGGGFEIRERDGAFGASTDVDLVLRSPVRNISVPRRAQMERLYVRMYDASAPPKYSRFSSAVFLNVPIE